MKYTDIVRFSLSNITHKKLRSWLTILGIVIGVASVVALVSIGEGAQASITSRLGGLGADMITVSSGFSRTGRGGFGFGGGGFGEGGATTKNLTESDVMIIKSTAGVLYVDGIASGRGELSYGGEFTTISVQGVDTNVWKNMITTGLASGRYLATGDTNVIVIGSNVASMFKTPLTINRMVSIEGANFKIVGILQSSGGFGGSDSTVFMPVQNARQIFNLPLNKISSISIKVNDASMAINISDAITQRLIITRHDTANTQDFTVTSSAAAQQQVSSITGTLTLFLAAIASISLLVGGIGISNTMFTSVLERTRQIGILKSLGATDNEVMKIFLTESGLIGLIGGITGAVIGIAASFVITEIGIRIIGNAGTVTVISPQLVAAAIGFSFIIGALSGVFPARRAARLQPVEALRYE